MSLIDKPDTEVTPPAPHDDVVEIRQHHPQWFQSAVFYELMVRTFQDSNGDGVGDLKGVEERLDYLAWLGVNCLWLPPFYPSPLRDGGYDVSDYTSVASDVGTVEDFKDLLDAAHARGLRIIVDFVMNHTSDQHAWFQASRTDPTGPYGDFYVWADDDTGYPDPPIIFEDVETSNWTLDPVRKQFFWHRFYSHQPDLNFENPAVRTAVLEAMRFWLDLGVDGFRLDAVPYLFAEEGTSCAHLPRTHAFLKEVRATVDRDYLDRVLLAEANGWPTEVADYFGDDDECHMAFHFPLMPRLFVALRRASRVPVTDILAQTPAAPANSQWGIFLRNHDELTLEAVTEEDRAYMLEQYAEDPRMKANVGIRRRLAPLLDNDTDRIELLNALLLSLPGSPVLYYGDEIGMGDNIWLGDRDGVRTPMQWTGERNAGFSRANPGKLYLPVIQDSVFGHHRVNVEGDLDNRSSLLHWTQKMLACRAEHPAFGLGSFEDLGGTNESVFAFLRKHGNDVVLCVNNFSPHPQSTDLDLAALDGLVPTEMTGSVTFPEITTDAYRLTIAGHGFLWFRLRLNATHTAEPTASLPVAASEQVG